MTARLFVQAIIKFVLGIILAGALIFLPVGTFSFANGVVIGAAVVFLAYPFIIAKRIKGEEAFLERELEGYREYKRKVKYRLIPFVW